MHIKKVELENFKSHADSTFEFSSGTTAITGANGAGKTSIIEAVAWALFDTLDYKKEEIVRRGAKKATVRVTFQSGLDERDYLVSRDSGTGYFIYDASLNAKIAEKKEEVTRLLRQHMNLDPGSDLVALFNHAIGVPQGTFTAVFLLSPADRKRTFDVLLKVEEYRKSAEELLKTSRFIENQVYDIRENIARIEGEIGSLHSIERESVSLESSIELSAKKIESTGVERAELSAHVAALEEQHGRIQIAEREVEKFRSSKTNLTERLKQKQTELSTAIDARKKIEISEQSKVAFLAANEKLQNLEQVRKNRDGLKSEHAKLEASRVAIEAEKNRISERLERADAASKTIQSLRPQAERQIEIEKKLEALRVKNSAVSLSLEQVKDIEKRLADLREAFVLNRKAHERAKENEIKASGRASLEKRDARLLSELARFKAELDRDVKFQREIQNGLCPILSERCLNLKDGQTLDQFVTSRFTELNAEIESAERERKQVMLSLEESRLAEKELGTVPILEKRSAEISAEGKRLAEEKTRREQDVKGIDDLRNEIERLETELRSLEDPRGRILLLEADAALAVDARKQLERVLETHDDLTSKLDRTRKELEPFETVDAEWQEYLASRQNSEQGYRVFMANEILASSLEQRHAEFAELEQQLGEAERLFDSEQSSLDRLKQGFDKSTFEKAVADLRTLDNALAADTALLEANKRRADSLSSEMARLAERQRSLAALHLEKAKLARIADEVSFIRSTLKEAAPRVARNYVQHVSAESNQIFLEINANAEQTLRWNDDYSISLEEAGFERPFSSLSGGEQMVAAVSVRLALLKQLSDIRLAFFDEPTVNLDAERRERLAEQISRIRDFDQLFVISHDDTFEGYFDNEIHVG